jgi:hypothetical protein
MCHSKLLSLIEERDIKIGKPLRISMAIENAGKLEIYKLEKM